MKIQVYFDWEKCRVREGYYQIKPGIDYCIQRAKAYAPHADLIWMETKIPSIPDARKFAEGVKVRQRNETAVSDAFLTWIVIFTTAIIPPSNAGL